AKGCGGSIDLAIQVPIGKDPFFASLSLPDDGRLGLAPRGSVAIDTVIGDVELAAYEPLGPGSIPFQHLVPVFEPVELAGGLGPVALDVPFGSFVDGWVGGDGGSSEVFGRRILSIL